jgi:orotidine-5'-phosphate decarboxylase
LKVAEVVRDMGRSYVGACGYSDIGAVVGATYPEELAVIRKAMPETTFLVPGYGAQGGTAEDVRGAFNADGYGAVVSSSRGIIFADSMLSAAERAKSDIRKVTPSI